MILIDKRFLRLMGIFPMDLDKLDYEPTLCKETTQIVCYCGWKDYLSWSIIGTGKRRE